MKIFLGPTKPTNIPASATVLPPAQQGDIAAAALQGPDTLILIDGLFHQSLAPWHKEILFALDNGCRVIGAGSLGALRAVETARYGAEPVGIIADWYGASTCTDDGDVAVAHAPAEDGYRSLTLPIVNLRATLETLIADGLWLGNLSETLAICRSIYYVERTWGALRQALGTPLADLLRDNYRDQKALDAESAITHASSVTAPARREAPAALHTPYLSALLSSDLPTACGKRLHELTTDPQRTAATDAYLVAYLAESLGMQPSKSEIHAASTRMWHRLGIFAAPPAEQWLATNNMTDQAWYDEAYQEALRQSARDWFEATHCAFDTTPMTAHHKLHNPKN